MVGQRITILPCSTEGHEGSQEQCFNLELEIDGTDGTNGI